MPVVRHKRRGGQTEKARWYDTEGAATTEKAQNGLTRESKYDKMGAVTTEV